MPGTRGQRLPDGPSARILEGHHAGDTARFVLGEAGSDPALAVGQVVRVGTNPAAVPGGEIPPYSLRDLEREGPLLWLAAAFGAFWSSSAGCAAPWL